jgi:hypothetical protein
MPFFFKSKDMNPASINTTNVLQFGYRAIFDLENARLILDIANLTIFKAGGETSIQGINFSVIDPSGIPISVVDFPNVDLSPDDIGDGVTTYNVQLSNSPSQYGWYIIKGVLREADGHEYSVEVSKEICIPKDIKKGIVPGKFEHLTDCTVPKLTILESTNLAYKGKEPETVYKDGKLYYPAGTLNPVSFTYTPFNIIGSGKVYTGDYTIRNKTTALYNLGDNVYVQITYGSTHKFTVNCNTNICDILCCIQKLQDVVTRDSTSLQGRDAKQKIDSVSMPLIIALSMEKCGKNAGDVIEEIAKTLNCSCNCDGSEYVEARPIITTFDPVELDGQCATTVVLVDGVWVIKTKTVTISTTEVDQSFVITPSETDCAINYSVKINKSVLAGAILSEIGNSPSLKNIFNSLIEDSGLDFSGLDGKCIIESSGCTYRLVEDASNAGKTVLNIFIDGVTYAAPTGLGVRNAAGIKTWLNSLGKGTFEVVYDITTNPVSTIITNSDTSHTIGTLVFIVNDEFVIRQFPKYCLNLEQVLQSLINYLCDISDNQVKLSQSYTICYIDNTGIVKQTAVPTTKTGGVNHITDLITAFINAYCISISNLKALIKVDCAAIKAVFVATDALKETDGVMGSRDGKCGMWTQRDMVVSFLNYMTQTNDQALIDQFCELRNKCVVAVCNPVTYSEGELIEPCPGISTISGSFTN